MLKFFLVGSVLAAESDDEIIKKPIKQDDVSLRNGNNENFIFLHNLQTLFFLKFSSYSNPMRIVMETSM